MDGIFVLNDLDETPQSDRSCGLQFNIQLLRFKYYRAGPDPGHQFTDFNGLARDGLGWELVSP